MRPADGPVDPAAVDVRLVVCDLDGVVWLSRQAIPGSPEAVARLRSAGVRVLFATNNSAALVAEHEAALEAIGIPATGDVVTSSQAAALLVEPGERVMVVGGRGIHEALVRRGAHSVAAADCERDGDPVSAVVCGLDLDFSYRTLDVASAAVRAGARLIATNDDATYPTPHGLIPGGGAVLAAVERAAGMTATVAGKPYAPMAVLVHRRCPDVPAAATVMVGDRPETDGRFAAELGCRYAQVRTGVVPHGVDVPEAAIDAADLAGVAAALLTTGAASPRHH